MENNLRDSHVRYHFQSILNVLIHFSFSLTQLVSILAILGLQIALTLTQTCPHSLYMGYWSFPFLLLSPLSVWLVMWRRSSGACLLAVLLHFCSTLFATAITIVSFLVLIGQMDFVCATATWSSFHLILNSSLIGMSLFFKLFNYAELILLYLLVQRDGGTSSVFFSDTLAKNDSLESSFINVNIWRSWSAVLDEKQKNADTFFA